MNERKFYRVEEVAEEFDVTPRTVERWIKSGELDAVKIGHTRRVISESIEEIKNKHRQIPLITVK